MLKDTTLVDKGKTPTPARTDKIKLKPQLTLPPSPPPPISNKNFDELPEYDDTIDTETNKKQKN